MFTQYFADLEHFPKPKNHADTGAVFWDSINGYKVNPTLTAAQSETALGLKADIAGQAFSGNISAPNIYDKSAVDALIAGVSAPDLTPYALLAGASFTGNISTTQSVTATLRGKFAGGTVAGTQIGGYVDSGAHRAQIIATGSQAPLVIAGGSCAAEFWDATTPTYAWAFGLAIPGGSTTSDYIFSQDAGSGYVEQMRIKGNKTLTSGVGVFGSWASGLTTHAMFTHSSRLSSTNYALLATSADNLYNTASGGTHSFRDANSQIAKITTTESGMLSDFGIGTLTPSQGTAGGGDAATLHLKGATNAVFRMEAASGNAMLQLLQGGFPYDGIYFGSTNDIPINLINRGGTDIMTIGAGVASFNGDFHASVFYGNGGGISAINPSSIVAYPSDSSLFLDGNGNWSTPTVASVAPSIITGYPSDATLYLDGDGNWTAPSIPSIGIKQILDYDYDADGRSLIDLGYLVMQTGTGGAVFNYNDISSVGTITATTGYFDDCNATNGAFGNLSVSSSTSAPSSIPLDFIMSPPGSSYGASNSYLLGNPDNWLLVTVGGTPYKVPLYA